MATQVTITCRVRPRSTSGAVTEGPSPSAVIDVLDPPICVQHSQDAASDTKQK